MFTNINPYLPHKSGWPSGESNYPSGFIGMLSDFSGRASGKNVQANNFTGRLLFYIR